MNSGVKTVLILLLLGGVVFGVTVIASYTGGFQQVAPGDDPSGEAGGPVGEPLVFALTEVGYDPLSTDADWGNYKRAFPGFYEVSPELNYQTFWFQQPHKKEVRVAVKGRSCSACTSARIGTLPADPLGEYVRQVREGKVPPPIGPAEALTASLLAAGVSVNKQVQWQEFDFDHTDKVVTLPAAGPDGPRVGLFQMIYKVTVIGPKTLDAYVAMSVGDSPTAQMKLSVASYGMPGFRLLPADGKVQFGDLPEGMPPRSLDLICWSATRRLAGPGRTLPPPAVAVSPSDPFVEVGTPVAIPEADLGKVAAALEVDKVLPPVLSAYRVPVTVHRFRPPAAPAGTPAEPDVGPFERQVAFIVPGEQASQTVTLSGTNTGLVALADAKLLDLESFPSRTGKPEKAFNLVSDRPNLKLTVAADECKPRFVTVRLGEPEDGGSRRRWRLTLSVPADAGLGEFPADSVVVFLADTGDGPPRRIKVPLKGRAHTGR